MTSFPSAPAIGPAADLRADLTGAFGLPAWGPGVALAPSFRISFGQPDPFHPLRGQWCLRVYSAWRIETPGTVLGAAGYDHESIERAVTALVGRSLVGADVELPSLSAAFYFSDDVRLVTFSYSHDHRHWILFRPDRTVRLAGPDGFWALAPRTAPDDGGETTRAA